MEIKFCLYNYFLYKNNISLVKIFYKIKQFIQNLKMPPCIRTRPLEM